MFFFGFGKLIYVTVLIINAIAVLSEDRFLARIGWGRTQTEPAFGASQDSTSVKARLVKLIDSVRTLMRSTFFLPFIQVFASRAPQEQSSPARSIWCLYHVQAAKPQASRPRLTRICLAVPLLGINILIIVYELILG
ncbi:unnamed protein product [Penicillium pancosmium]